MTTVLGRKQTSNNAVWLEVLNHIEEYVARKELDQAVQDVLNDIRLKTKGKRVAFAWSGGKDSIVLADICRKAKISDCVFAHTRLEYPAFLEWCLAHRPKGCDVLDTGLDLDWLSRNQSLIFPDGKKINRWYQLIQRHAFTQYFFDHKLDLLLVGHRRADGNFVGKGNIVTKSSGETRYSPLADWSHELILAYIHYHKLPLPLIYGWEDGFICGTHPWPSRPYVKNVEQGYQQIYNIDKTILTAAAEKIPSARHFLEVMEHG